MEIIADLVIALRGRYIDSEACVSDFLGLDLTQLRANLALGTAVSALRTAIIELQCQTEGVGMTEAMGGLRQDSVQLYANINRTPTQFGAVAERAIRQHLPTSYGRRHPGYRPSRTGTRSSDKGGHRS